MTLRRFTLGCLSAGALLGAGAILVSAPLSSAMAADLDYGYGGGDLPTPPVIPEQKVEFGSGWYVRGDLAATAIPKVSATTPTNASIDGIFYDNAPSLLFSKGNRPGYTASLGAGYAFLNGIRTDFVADFHQPISSSFNGAPYSCTNGYGLNPSVSTTTYTSVNGTIIPVTDVTPASSYRTYGTCTGTFKASLKSYDVLINGYYDLGTWYGATPYIGAGVGLAFGHYSTAATYSQADGSSYNITITDPISGSSYHIYQDRFATGNYYNFAFALMAGVSFDVFPHTKLDVGYRYLNEGRVYGVNLYEHEARAGLRYMIDN